MFPEQQYLQELTSRARAGDAQALSELHTEMDPHVERFIRRAVRLAKPRTDFDRQLRALARHNEALGRYPQRQAAPGVVKRVLRTLYQTLWNPRPAYPVTSAFPAKTVCC